MYNPSKKETWSDWKKSYITPPCTPCVAQGSGGRAAEPAMALRRLGFLQFHIGHIRKGARPSLDWDHPLWGSRAYFAWVIFHILPLGYGIDMDSKPSTLMSDMSDHFASKAPNSWLTKSNTIVPPGFHVWGIWTKYKLSIRRPFIHGYISEVRNRTTLGTAAMEAEFCPLPGCSCLGNGCFPSRTSLSWNEGGPHPQHLQHLGTLSL